MFKDIVNPTLITQLSRLAVVLKSQFNTVVSDLQYRLVAWLSNNDTGNFVLDNFQNWGFYWVKVNGLTNNPSTRKTTMNFDLKNLFTDRSVMVGKEIVFNQQGGGESNPIEAAGFQWLQWNPEASKNFINSYIANNSFPYPTIFTKEANEFNDVVLNGTGSGSGNVIVRKLPEPGTVPNVITKGNADTTPANNNGLIEAITKNPMYLILGGAALYFLVKK